VPLLDHFRPPLIDTRSWEGFHTAWIAYISESLNRLLPPGYFAEETAHAGPHVEIDVATFGVDGPPPGGPHLADPGRDGGAAVAEPAVWAPPDAVAVPVEFADDFEVKVIGTRGGRRLVAAVELVSPGNKDRAESRRAFAVKVASYVHQGVAVVVVDVVTDRSANLHHEAMDLFFPSPPAAARLAADARLYAAAYRPVRRGGVPGADVWAGPLAVGGPLPTLPLWLTAADAVPVYLEATYTDACRRRRIAG
jgi:hypothetical protein